MSCCFASTNGPRTSSRRVVASRRPPLATSAEPWVPPVLAAASGADEAFCVGIPLPKGRGGSAAKSKDQKPWWGLQPVIPQPGKSHSPGDLLLLSQPLAPTGLQQAEPRQRLRASPAACGGTGRRRAQTEQTRLHAALRRQPAPGPAPPPAQGWPVASAASAAPTTSPLGRVPSAQLGQEPWGVSPALTGSAELWWSGGVGGGGSALCPPCLEGRTSPFLRDVGEGAALQASRW